MPTEQSLAHDPHRPQMWIKPYYKSFNGLRGLAVGTVFLHHYAGFWHANGLQSYTWAGVDLFFVLSGFLITGILYDALERPHFFRNFYVRRALRIFPLFYGFFLLVFLCTPLLHLHYSWSLWSFVFYVGNLVVPFADLTTHNPTVISIVRHGEMFEFINIGHLWSLCVEEQFYLLWPAVVWQVRDRRTLMRVCIAGCVAVLLIRIVLRGHGHTLEHHFQLLHWSTYTRCDTLLAGAWLALWLRGRALSLVQLKQYAYTLFWVPGILLAAGMLYFVHSIALMEIINSWFMSTIGYTLIALVCVGILLFALDESGSLSRMLRFWPLRALGVISYGFYFIHMLPEAMLNRYATGAHPALTAWMPLGAFVFTVVTATLSFHFFETPFLKLKERWAPGHRSADTR